MTLLFSFSSFSFSIFLTVSLRFFYLFFFLCCIDARCCRLHLYIVHIPRDLLISHTHTHSQYVFGIQVNRAIALARNTIIMHHVTAIHCVGSEIKMGENKRVNVYPLNS